MDQEQVARILTEEPGLQKEIRLNDGKRILVRERERWLAGPVLVVLEKSGDLLHIAYRNITSIRVLATSARRGNGRR